MRCWTRLIGSAAMVALASCSTGSGGAAPGPCIAPPPDQINQASDLLLSIEPNPVDGGEIAVLSVELGDLPIDALVGAGVEWQCWDGSEWVPTHQVVRGFDGHEPATNEVPPGATTAVVAIGLSIPNAYDIVVPDVAPGRYRIADRAVVPGGDETPGFVIVIVE